jgi:hypothetical protein
MSPDVTPMPVETPPLPVLPCPNCGENILQEGFYNSCTETQTLREENYTHIVKDHLYMDHIEDGHQLIDHECDLEAYCSSCDKLLPWPLYRIRELDGAFLVGIDKIITKLLEEGQGKLPDA